MYDRVSPFARANPVIHRNYMFILTGVVSYRASKGMMYSCFFVLNVFLYGAYIVKVLFSHFLAR